MTCPGHVINQWLAALRAFAPSLRCRRADARPRDARAAPEHDVSNVGLERLDADALPDWSPLRGGVQAWDVLVVANEDLPRGCRRKDDSSDEPPFHPLWNDPMAAPDPASIEWTRLIVDEPQELLFDWRPAAAERGAGAWLVDDVRAAHRWALSATPGATDVEKRDLLSLTFGRRVSRLEFRRVRARWFAKRTRRDPPDACLPRAPLSAACVPVTLSWREAAAVQLYAEAPDATFGDVVRLCGGWRDGARGNLAAFFGDDGVAIGNGRNDDRNGPVESLEAWHARLTRAHERNLARLEKRRDALASALADSERRGAARLAAEGGYNPFEQLDDLLTEEALLDGDGDANGDGDAPGDAGWGGEGGGALTSARCARRCARRCAPPRRRQGSGTRTISRGSGGTTTSPSTSPATGRGSIPRIPTVPRIPIPRIPSPRRGSSSPPSWRRSTAVGATRRLSPPPPPALRDETAECSVCFERLRGKTVTVLRCAHAFDAACVARLILASRGARRAGAPADAHRQVQCPLCRAPTRRRDMCTFVHRRDGRGGGADEQEAGPDGEAEPKESDAESGPSSSEDLSAKTSALVSAVANILRTRPDDKIVVFAQWPTPSPRARRRRRQRRRRRRTMSSGRVTSRRCLGTRRRAPSRLRDSSLRARTRPACFSFPTSTTPRA